MAEGCAGEGPPADERGDAYGCGGPQAAGLVESNKIINWAPKMGPWA
jgi:hypothetical protein